MQITFKGSPNYGTNRTATDRIVIHWFGGGTLSSANTRFQNAANQVSAHYGISDETVWQWVKEEHVAWHCGNLTMNRRSIGIEHDATPDRPATDKTYYTAARLLADIAKRHGIPLDRTHVIKHSEVKATQCCGTLDIDRIIREARAFQEVDEANAQPAEHIWVARPETKLQLPGLSEVVEAQALVSRLKAGDRAASDLEQARIERDIARQALGTCQRQLETASKPETRPTSPTQPHTGTFTNPVAVFFNRLALWAEAA